MNKFYYQKSPRSKFSILFASNPKNPKRYESRGIYLLLETAKNCKDILFDFAWRPNNSGLNIKELIQQKEVNNAVFTNQYITDMNPRYGLAHCTIIPFLRNKDVKLMPNSAIESLAAGKPVLCSSKSGIAEIITRYKVGIVFEPTLFSLVKAIEKLKNNYQYYQKNCRKTAELLFSESKFKSEYSDLFDKLLYSASNEKNLKTIFL